MVVSRERPITPAMLLKPEDIVGFGEKHGDVGRESLERRRHILFKLLSTPRQLSRSPAGGGESMMVHNK